MVFGKVDAFLRKVNRMKSLIERGKYEKALARYYSFNSLYKSLHKEEKEKYRIEYQSVVNCLLLYNKLEDLKVFLKEDNLDLVRDALSVMKYLLISTPKNTCRKFMRFVDLEYDKHFEEFSYRLAISELDEKLDFINKLKDEENYDIALNSFPELINKYREIESYGRDSSRIHDSLISLREELKTSLLEFRAKSPVAKVNVKTLRKALKNKEMKTARFVYKELFR
jgi:hypothetical protein